MLPSMPRSAGPDRWRHQARNGRRAKRRIVPRGAVDPAAGRTGGRYEANPVPGVPVSTAVSAVGRPEIWFEQGVSLYRIAQSMINAVATIWIPPSTTNTPAPMAMARAVIRTDDSNHTANASLLMPAEQRALIKWEICGT